MIRMIEVLISGRRYEVDLDQNPPVVRNQGAAIRRDSLIYRRAVTRARLERAGGLDNPTIRNYVARFRPLC